MVELQARVNHSPTTLEVTLQDKQGSLLEGRLLTVQILTEDDLTAIQVIQTRKKNTKSTFLILIRSPV